MSALPVVVRSSVSTKSSYHEYRDDLRYDFYYACAYCTITEVEAEGVGWEIDHYLPQEKFPELTNDYANLMLACQHCNNHKRDWYPSPENETAGIYLIKVDREDPSNHLTLDGETVKATSITGDFNIQLLLLNRQSLVRLRTIRHSMSHSAELITSGLRYAKNVPFDVLPQELKVKVGAVSRDITRRIDDLTKSIEDYVRDISKSPLLDSDPEKEQQRAVRVQYLESVNALQHIKLDRKLKRAAKR